METLVHWVTLTAIDSARYDLLRLAEAQGADALARALAAGRYHLSGADQVLLADQRELPAAALPLRLRQDPRTWAEPTADWLVEQPRAVREKVLLDLVKLPDEEWISHVRLVLASVSPSYAEDFLADREPTFYDAEPALYEALGKAAENCVYDAGQVASLTERLHALELTEIPRGETMRLARAYLKSFLPGLPVEVSYFRWLRAHLLRLRDFYDFLREQGHGVCLGHFRRAGAPSLTGPTF